MPRRVILAAMLFAVPTSAFAVSEAVKKARRVAQIMPPIAMGSKSAQRH